MKRTLAILLGIVTLLTLGSSQLLAHHAFYSVYDRDKTIKIEGTLKEFIWRNPHSFVRVEAPDDKGDVQSWVIEWAAPAQLTERAYPAPRFALAIRSSLRATPGASLKIIGSN